MTNPHEIAFIDSAVTDVDTLLSGLRPDVEAIILSRTEPAVAQMARAVEGQTDLGAIHVIAHGLPGEVRFAAGALSVETIEDEAAGLRSLGAALGAQGILSIWACHTGAAEGGAAAASHPTHRTADPSAATHAPARALSRSKDRTPRRRWRVEAR